MKKYSVLLIAAAVLSGCFFLYLSLPPLLLRQIPVPCSAQVLDRDGKILHLFTAKGGYWRLPSRLERIDPEFIRLLLACEDKRFWSHWGVDPLALGRAVKQLARHGRAVSGASTITMQTVRLLHPRPRTVLSKLIEMAEALRFERHLSKQEILETYLTLAPYGGNIEGIEAASRFYFQKDAARLTPSEIALLISLPQSPERRRPDRHPEQAELARSRVLERLAENGLLSSDQAKLARTQPLPAKRHSAPFLAPQFSRQLRALQPEKELLLSSLDRTVQEKMEAIAAQAQQRLGEEGKRTLALLAVDNRSRQVLAHVGSGGWRISSLDLTKARRSPGSALKPFIYGLAFEQGILHPETLILDRPDRFGSYGPDNFDRTHHGWVSVREALHRSLNLPAVQVLERVGPQNLLARFASVGVFMGRSQAEAGLSLALGGTATNLHDLTALYAALADQGEFRPITFNPAAPPGPENRLLAPAAAWQVDEILRNLPAAAGLQTTAKIRYKTGTSYGFRDAWAIGYTRQHTIGVWVGRPDGGYGKRTTGAELAVPVLLQAFAALPAQVEAADIPPAGFRRLSHNQLPPHLQYFSRSAAEQSQPRIYYPVDGSSLHLSGEPVLVLKAHGGAPPFHWLINGQPVAKEQQSEIISCPPPGPGLARITLIDSQGRRDRISVWVNLEN
ncbi:penicillin-binding protein 1C [Candidatus Electronema sp. TJ]|uniref:penicillin-binding protein 1C n=1 Tax=Candidatus Electronema sp. TJ TaxID=3401573 RepID=UPI003AA7ABA9